MNDDDFRDQTAIALYVMLMAKAIERRSGFSSIFESEEKLKKMIDDAPDIALGLSAEFVELRKKQQTP